MKNYTLVDTNSHILPDQYLNALKAAGTNNIQDYPLPDWSLEDHLSVMESNGITKCLISISTSDVNFFEGDIVNLTRALNREISAIKNSYPDKFGVFALLPLPNIEAAVEEITYALDVLKLDGIGLYTNYHGVYPGDEKLDAVFDLLNKRKALVFIHPAAPPDHEKISLGFPLTMLEYPVETTKTVANLLKSGTLARYKDIKLIITHGRGTVPLFAPHIANLLAVKKHMRESYILKKEYGKHNRLHFNLATSNYTINPDAIKFLVTTDHLLMGFDFSFLSEPFSKGTTNN